MAQANALSLSVLTAVYEDCKQRDSRCCRALLADSLEEAMAVFSTKVHCENSNIVLVLLAAEESP